MEINQFRSAGGGKDLETAAAYAERMSKATTSAATITVPKAAVSSPFLGKQIKIPLSSLSSASSSPKPIVVKGIGNLNTIDGKQIRFIPPKVNTANNRVPSTPGTASGGSGETLRAFASSSL